MTTGGTGFIIPKYDLLVSPTTYQKNGLSQNPVEVAAQPFSQLRGLQELTITDNSTGFSASVYVTGGYTNNSGGFVANVPEANYHYVNNTSQNCTITFPASANTPLPNVFYFNTTAADSGGRSYTITYNPYGAQPTVLKTTGAPLAGSLTVSVKVAKIMSGQFIF